MEQNRKQNPERNLYIYRNLICIDHWERADYFINGLRTIWFPNIFSKPENRSLSFITNKNQSG